MLHQPVPLTVPVPTLSSAPSSLPSAQRRRVLQGAGAVAAFGLAALQPGPARAGATAQDPARLMAAKTFAEAIGLLGGTPLASALVTLQAPAQAENGAFVPITVASALQGTREILILVDGNPQPVAAQFMFPTGTDAFVTTRIRLAGDGTVMAAVRTDDGVYAASCSVAVTLGGCG